MKTQPRGQTHSRAGLLAATLLLAGSLPAYAQLVGGQSSGEKEEDHYFDDRAVVLATIHQDNGNVLEFLSNPELEELTLWETGPAQTAGPVFADDELDKISMLEAYLQLVPAGHPVPADLVRYSRGLEAGQAEKLIEGRQLVEKLEGTLEIGQHMAAPPANTRADCVGIGTGPYDWGPVFRNSGCNVDGRTNFLKARICNLSDWGSIRMQLGYKHTCSSNSFNYPSSKTKDVAHGDYAYVQVDSVTRCRRARYVNWDAFYEQAIVGGWMSGSPTSNNCG